MGNPAVNGKSTELKVLQGSNADFWIGSYFSVVGMEFNRYYADKK